MYGYMKTCSSYHDHALSLLLFLAGAYQGTAAMHAALVYICSCLTERFDIKCHTVLAMYFNIYLSCNDSTLYTLGS